MPWNDTAPQRGRLFHRGLGSSALQTSMCAPMPQTSSGTGRYWVARRNGTPPPKSSPTPPRNSFRFSARSAVAGTLVPFSGKKSVPIRAIGDCSAPAFMPPSHHAETPQKNSDRPDLPDCYRWHRARLLARRAPLQRPFAELLDGPFWQSEYRHQCRRSKSQRRDFSHRNGRSSVPPQMDELRKRFLGALPEEPRRGTGQCGCPNKFFHMVPKPNRRQSVQKSEHLGVCIVPPWEPRQGGHPSTHRNAESRDGFRRSASRRQVFGVYRRRRVAASSCSACPDQCSKPPLYGEPGGKIQWS